MAYFDTGESRRALFHNKCRYAFSSLAFVCLRKYNCKVPGSGIRDPGLVPIQDPVITVFNSSCFDGRGVTPGIRLDCPQCTYFLSGNYIGYEFFLLLISAESHYREGLQSRSDHKISGDRVIIHGERLRNNAKCQPVEPQPAVLLRNHNTQQALIAHLLHDLRKELLFSVSLLNSGKNFSYGEILCHISKHNLLVGKLKIHFVFSFLPYLKSRNSLQIAC